MSCRFGNWSPSSSFSKGQPACVEGIALVTGGYMAASHNKVSHAMMVLYITRVILPVEKALGLWPWPSLKAYVPRFPDLQVEVYGPDGLSMGLSTLPDNRWGQTVDYLDNEVYLCAGNNKDSCLRGVHQFSPPGSHHHHHLYILMLSNAQFKA